MAVGLPLKTTYADGDVYSASDVNDTNGTVNLFQTSTLSYSAGKNAIINGGMDIWQRGTSITGTSGIPHTADRWQVTRVGATGYTTTRQSSGSTLPEIQYCLRAQRDSGNTNTTLLGAFYSVESVNSIPFAGKATTLSFYVRKGANYSGGALTVEFSQGTGTDQNVISGGFTGKTNVGSSSVTLTTSWQRVSITGTVATTTTQLGLQFYYTPSGTAGAADYFELTGVQVEYGSVATTFSRTGASIQGELAACQRYYLSWVTGTTQTIGIGTYTGGGTAVTTANFPVTMRIQPSLVVATGTNYYKFNRVSADDDFNSFTIFNASFQAMGFYNASEVSGTSGTSGYMYTNNASASIAFNAEL
jgi:hypothetical protein